jgi:hypothetical protein
VKPAKQTETAPAPSNDHFTHLAESGSEFLIATAARLAGGDNQGERQQLEQQLNILREERGALQHAMSGMSGDALTRAQAQLTHLDQEISQVEQRLADLDRPHLSPRAALLLRGKPIIG